MKKLEPVELKALNNDKIKTVTTSLKEVIKLKMDQLQDLATLEVLMRPDVRMRKRLESIRKMGQARHLKINGHWKTTPPQMHMRGLEGRKLDNDTYEVRFSVFEMDKDKNKVPHENKSVHETAEGNKVERVNSIDYKIAYEVVEIIKYKKPIEREIIKMEE